MKKLYALLTGSIFAFSALSANISEYTNIEDMKNMMMKELENRSFSISNSNTVETHVIKYATADDGSHLHIGVWSDCIIGTVVGNASNIGSQMILWNNGTLFDSSNKYSKHSKYFTNKYGWGTVTSYDYKQVIKKK